MHKSNSTAYCNGRQEGHCVYEIIDFMGTFKFQWAALMLPEFTLIVFRPQSPDKQHLHHLMCWSDFYVCGKTPK